MYESMKQPDDKGAEIMRRFSVLLQERAPYEGVWDDITEFVLPSRGTYSYSNKGDISNPERKSRRRLDSTATYAHRALTARVIAEFTNSGSRWFEYRAPDPKVDKLHHVRSFLQGMSDKVYQKLNASSFILAHTEVTADWCAYGTACMLAEDNGKKGYTWTSISPSEIWIAENKDNEVDCVYRKYQLTYKQLCESFGPESLPDDIHMACESTPHRRFDILHSVEPNSAYNPQKKSARYFGFNSTFVLMTTQTTLKTGNFKRRPYIVFRFWKRTNEVYGGSPGIDALADIRMLNVMKDVYIRAAQLTAAPPQGLAHDSVISPLKLVPYGVNYGAISSDGKKLVTSLLEGNLSLSDLRDMITDTVQQIRAAFFVDPLMNRETSIRTAAEVGKRANEEMTGLAPFLARFDVEYLSIVLDTMLEYVLDHENTDPIPPELQGMVPRIEYTGPLAKTQRGQELNNNLQFAQIAQTVGNVDPTLMQNVDWNAWLRNVAELLGVPMDNINSPEHMQAMAAAQQQQQQQAQMMQMAQGAASTVTDAAKAGLISRADLGLPQQPEGI
jgi:hypothetical protein